MDINPQWITLIFACNAMIASIASAFAEHEDCKNRVQRECAVGQPSEVDRDDARPRSKPDRAAHRRGGCAPDSGRANRPCHCPGPRAVEARGDPAADDSQDRTQVQPARVGSSEAHRLDEGAADQVRSPSPEGGIEDRIEIISRAIIQVSQGILSASGCGSNAASRSSAQRPASSGDEIKEIGFSTLNLLMPGALGRFGIWKVDPYCIDMGTPLTSPGGRKTLPRPRSARGRASR